MHTTSLNASHRIAAAGLFVALFVYSSQGVAQAPQAAKLTPVAASKVVQPSAPVQPIQALPAAAQPTDLRLEQIGMGDLVRVSVFRNPELTTEARVSERGTIMFPMIGEISVAGLTPSQVSKAIGDRLAAGRYVVNPEVTVSLAQINSRQVSVLGNVQKPGRYPIDSTTARLTDLLALAGGIAPTGDDRVTVMTTRDGKTTRQDIDVAHMINTGDVSKNVELQAGDTIYVGRAPMIYVTGEVARAGAYRIEKDMTVMQAIALGGGITPRGTDRGIRIHRKNGDGQIHRMEARLNDPVKVDDVIFVRESLF